MRNGATFHPNCLIAREYLFRGLHATHKRKQGGRNMQPVARGYDRDHHVHHVSKCVTFLFKCIRFANRKR